MVPPPTFDELVAEGESVPVEGWDFSWLEGRATEERPPWGYSRLLAQRMAGAEAALDIQTGGGEVLAQIPHPPPVLVATEAWPPNIKLARRNLAPLGAAVIEVGRRACRSGRGPLTWPSAVTRSARSGRRSGASCGQAARISRSRSGRAPTVS